MAPNMIDTARLEELVTTASAILDAASLPFVAGHRAESAVRKQGNDFATEVDLAIERQVVQALTEATGIGVHGEEFGGEPVDSALVWVLDPIDGTINYAAGSPMAGILLGLLAHGEPVAGLTWVPFAGQKFSAVVGQPFHENGVAQPPLATSALPDAILGMQSFKISSRGRFPGRYRASVTANLTQECSRIRMHGATGVDLAYVAAGVLGGAVSFGHHVWDHAAGVALVRAAGGIVTDLAGEPWTAGSHSALAAAPGVHERMLEIVKETGKPEDYL